MTNINWIIIQVLIEFNLWWLKLQNWIYIYDIEINKYNLNIKFTAIINLVTNFRTLFRLVCNFLF